MSNITTRVCDICGEHISAGLPGNGFIFGYGDYQAFSTEDGEKDSCHSCNTIADTIMRWFKVKPDKSEIYRRAGFTFQGDRWTRSDGSIIFDEMSNNGNE